MKCPKCQYISFDSGERCRNCGYDFSLVPDVPARDDAADLPIQNGTEAEGPFSDFSLNETPNLPLFTRGTGDSDAPLVTPAAAPRAPLAVRRAAQAGPRVRVRRDNTLAEPRLALDNADLPITLGTQPEMISVPEPASAEPVSVAPAGARILGGLVDLLLLAGIDLAVVYFTLRICDLTFAETLTLPLAPLIGFLVLLNGGYLSTFVAASGQTIGKMAAGTRVVPADPAAPVHERVSFGQATLRAAAYAVSAAPAGLGFLPGLIGRERRALHDRLADTRVVKA
jgi:uncharacterized RDD family membrane protein YckC